jgi:hypothetical protein
MQINSFESLSEDEMVHILEFYDSHFELSHKKISLADRSYIENNINFWSLMS